MARKYEILEFDDFKSFVFKLNNFIDQCASSGKPFPKMNVTVKSWRKDKTPKQHRYYWAVVGQMVKAFREVGCEYTKEEVHEFLKRAYGYTDEIVDKSGKVTHITKSIADKSDDVNIKIMMDLIDFAIRWTAINLDITIEDPRA